ncbi:energy-coupling factor ABC transporter ATP-binding protein [Butyrivibrio sp. INlla14]|uniref:energy-coupling factor ABC transporter ATP-binding protein n=1 Tax=Butyrivibrio sp. INlla14 TaxID=1520808 RepID=UPI0008765A89|nr:ABC transporter ATP-binding protein [Butyrivibrio sp. INlla14]SCY04610.1 cobalt/nickel transport system ATP-binding protein [Butyrivibrio sp. INlla14]
MHTGIHGEILKIEHLSFAYEKEEPVLSDINLMAHDGESIGIIGANGIGKSTLMKLLVGLYLDYEGVLEIAGHPVDKKNLNHVREHIGYVFQDSDSQLFLSTVEDDVAFGPQNYGLSDDEVEKRVVDALEKVHITDLSKKHTYKLSGGEKKLASIATILAMNPDIIIMDEPEAALDPRNRKNLIRIINEINSLKLITSHDLDFIMDTCERTILLDEGRIIADGRSTEILQNESLLTEHGLELPLRLQK